MSTLASEPARAPVAEVPPAKTVAEEPAMERVYVWSLPMRLIHWGFVLSMVVLAVTGIYIGWPFVTVAGEAKDHFFMGWSRLVHFYAGIAFTLAVLARIPLLFTGNPYERWDQFVPVARDRRRDMWGTFLFYTMLRRDAPPVVGHNPLAGFTYIAVYGLMLVMIVTGLALYAQYAHVDSPVKFFGDFLYLMGGPQTARWIHHGVMWLLLGFGVHHVYSGLLMAVSERTGTMESIFSGFKWVEKKEKK